MNRLKEIMKVSVIGIVVNIILVVFKAIIGFVSGSIAIVMDALNNLSDALSSIITIVGMFLAGKAPDKKHPYGYGKIEYITSLAISIIIFITGVSAFYESFKKVLHPETAEYTFVMLIIISVGILTKLFLGRFVKEKGKKLNSDSLIASGTDALFDAIIALSTLIGAVISMAFGISIDGYLGLIISVIIMKSGYEIIIDSFNEIIGARVDSEISNKIKNEINKYAEVYGTYDLILHQYGPEKLIGSTHIEVEDSLTAKQLHALTRKITEDIFNEFGVILTIGIYASNTDIDENIIIKNSIDNLIKQYPMILQIHGYYVNTENMTISFDLVFDFDEKNISQIKDEIIERLTNMYPKYTFNIIIDNDFSD